MDWRSLVPELVVSEFEVSLYFYTAILGFTVGYRRTEPLFACLLREGSQLTIQEWQPDSGVLGELERPFGRGMSLQIECSDVDHLRGRIAAAGITVQRELATVWYKAGDAAIGQRQFVVADPDGYLLRFCQVVGRYVASQQLPRASAEAPGRSS